MNSSGAPFAEIDHVLDYLQQNPQVRLNRLSYPQALQKADAWTKAMNKKNKNLRSSGEVKEVMTFPDSNLKMVRLLDQTAKDWEGKHMGHCVSSYKKHKGIYSLRDEDDLPHATLEIVRGTVAQIQGKGNQELVDKYKPMVLEFICRKKYNIRPGFERRLDLRGVTRNGAEILKHYFNVKIFPHSLNLKLVHTKDISFKNNKAFSSEARVQKWWGSIKIKLDQRELKIVVATLMASGNPEILEFLCDNFGAVTHDIRDFEHSLDVFQPTIDKLVAETKKTENNSRLQSFLQSIKLDTSHLCPYMLAAIKEEDENLVHAFRNANVPLSRHRDIQNVLSYAELNDKKIDLMLKYKVDDRGNVFLIRAAIEAKDYALLERVLQQFSNTYISQNSLNTLLRPEWFSPKADQRIVEIILPYVMEFHLFSSLRECLPLALTTALIETNPTFREQFFSPKSFNSEEYKQKWFHLSRVQHGDFIPSSFVDSLIKETIHIQDFEGLLKLKQLGLPVSLMDKERIEAKVKAGQELLKMLEEEK